MSKIVVMHIILGKEEPFKYSEEKTVPTTGTKPTIVGDPNEGGHQGQMRVRWRSMADQLIGDQLGSDGHQ